MLSSARLLVVSVGGGAIQTIRLKKGAKNSEKINRNFPRFGCRRYRRPPDGECR